MGTRFFKDPDNRVEFIGLCVADIKYPQITQITQIIFIIISIRIFLSKLTFYIIFIRINLSNLLIPIYINLR